MGVGHLHRFSVEVADLFPGEGNYAVGNSVERIILSDAYVKAGADFGAALTDDNVTDFGEFTGVQLGSKTLAVGIAAQFCGATCFSMCHI